MTIANNYVPVRQQGNGITTQVSASWPMISAAYAQVFLEDAATGVRTPVSQGGGANQYTITLTASGWVVTMGTAWTASQYLIVGRNTAVTQEDPYRTSTGFQGEVEEASFDKLTAIAQEQSNSAARALRFPLGDTTDGTLPAAVIRALGFQAYDAVGAPVIAVGGVTGVPVTAYAATLLDDVDAAAARATLGLGSVAVLNSIPNANITAGPAGTVKGTANNGVAVADLTAAQQLQNVLGVVSATNLPSQDAKPRNRVVDGGFLFNTKVNTSVADDAYAYDAWYVLAQSGNVGISSVANPENGQLQCIRLTQPDVSAKRIGLAQIIENADIGDLVSKAVALSGRVRLSTASAVRFAILEHTGTADSVTSDVVNDWTSTNYTPSNFFIAGVNVIAVGSATPGAATWGSLQASGTFGASMKNAIVFVWTEGALAQNGTLDIGSMTLNAGAIPMLYEPESRLLAQARTYRLFFYDQTGVLLWSGQCANGVTSARVVIRYPYDMRVSPTLTLTNIGRQGFPSTAPNANAAGARGFIAGLLANSNHWDGFLQVGVEADARL